MSYKHLLLSIFISGAFSSTFAKDIKVSQILGSESFAIRKPVMIDSLNVKKESFTNSTLLKSAFIPTTLKMTELSADTAGYFSVNKPQGNYEFSLYKFYIRSDRYAKATMEIQTPDMVQVFIDGKMNGEKNTVQDSLKNCGKAVSNLTLEPGQIEVLIKYLSDSTSKTEPVFNITIIPAKNDSLAIIETLLTENHPLTIEDLMTGTRVSTPEISYDGKYSIINYTTVLKDGKRAYSKYIIETSTGNILSEVSNYDDLMWMPKSNKLSFTKIGMNGRELRSLDPQNSREVLIADMLPKGYFSWSPEEDYLLFSVRDEFPADKKDLQIILTPDDRIPGWRNRNMLYKYDIKTGLFEQITFGYHNTYLNDFNKDGSKILFSEYELAMDQYPYRMNSYYQLDLNSFEIDTIWYKVPYINSIQYSPDNKKLLVLASANAFDSIGLNIKPEQTANIFDGQAYIYDLNSGNVKSITKEFNPSINRAVWNETDNKIYFNCTDKDLVDVYSFDIKSETFSKLPLEGDVVSGFNIASNAPVATYTSQSVSWPEKSYSYNLKSKKSSLISNPQENQASLYQLGEVKDWNFISADGSNIEGRYYLPVNFDPAKKYPMIVYYYSGTTPTDRSFFHPYSMHLYAAQGYVVYTLQPSGTIGFGQEFAARHVNAWGIQTAEDIITGVKKFCDDHSFVDKAKVGCMGASYGGFMTMYLQTRTDIFAAAVSHAGISALSSYWGEGFWGYSYSAAASAYSFPWNNPKLYVEQSPLFNADKINTPLLLLHGKVDTNVPIGESIQMFAALKLLGKQVDFIQVEGENHGISDFNRRLAWKKSIFAFFAKWLKDEPQWWEAQYPATNLD